jgi:hypothetical protein
MAKYKVLQPFRDKETGEEYTKNQEIEMTVKRAEEAEKNLKKWDGEFLERVDDKRKDKEDGK